MPPSLRDAAYLWDIVDCCRRAVAATRGLDLASYQSNDLVQAAVERWIEVIGEAARRLSEEFKSAHHEVPWSKIIGQRNVLAHQYREIRQEKLFQVVRQDLPRLLEQLEPELPPPPPPIED
jgi:uncharacterized protein with HEPN domain